MTDIVTLWAGAASIGCAGLLYLWRSAARDLRKAHHEVSVLLDARDALAGRVNTLRGDNADLQKANVELSRENGRLKAEQRAAKPKRGPDGKFVAKPKANV